MSRAIRMLILIILLLFGIFELVYGFLGVSIYGIFGVIPESGLPAILPLIVGVFLCLVSVYLLSSMLIKEGRMKRIVGVASSYEKITIAEISELSGVKTSNVKPLLFEAIAEGLLHGVIKENTFIRKEAEAEVIIEREVMVTRKAPEKCYKCGASLNPQEVEWVGPDQFRCAHCGAVMTVETERI